MIDSNLVATPMELKEEEPSCCPPVEAVPCTACYEKAQRDKEMMEKKLKQEADLKNNKQTTIIIEKKIQDLESNQQYYGNDATNILMGSMTEAASNVTVLPIHDLTESALSLQRVPPPSVPHPHADSPPSNITHPKAYIRHLPNPDSSPTSFAFSAAVSSQNLSSSAFHNNNNVADNSARVANMIDAQPINRMDNARVSFLKANDVTAAKAAMSYFGDYASFNEQSANTSLQTPTGVYPATASLHDASVSVQPPGGSSFTMMPDNLAMTMNNMMVPSFGSMNMGVVQPLFFMPNPALTTLPSMYSSNASMFGTMAQQYMAGSIAATTATPSNSLYQMHNGNDLNSPLSRTNVSSPANGGNNPSYPHSHNTNRQVNNSDKMIATFKTEICRAHQITGICEYGPDCQFAHGLDELRTREVDTKYKTERCKNYHTLGPNSCWYGSRCKFIHDEYRVRVGEYEFWLISPGDNIVRIERIEKGNSARIAQLQQLISEQIGMAATASAALTSQLHISATAASAVRANSSPSVDQKSSVYNIREIVAASLLRNLVAPSGDMFNLSPAMNVQAMHVAHVRGSISNPAKLSPTNACIAPSTNPPISFGRAGSPIPQNAQPLQLQSAQVSNANAQHPIYNSFESHMNQLSRLLSKTTLSQGQSLDLQANIMADELKKKKKHPNHRSKKSRALKNDAECEADNEAVAQNGNGECESQTTVTSA